MDINITFIIQGINFGLCYVVLKHMFLKPAITFINEREQQYNKLVRDLEQDELALQEKIVYKDALVGQFKMRVGAQFPREQGVTSERVSYPVTYHYSKADVVACQDKLKELMTKACDAHS